MSEMPTGKPWTRQFEEMVETGAQAAYEADDSPYSQEPWGEAPESRRKVWLDRARTILLGADVEWVLGELYETTRLVPGDVDSQEQQAGLSG